MNGLRTGIEYYSYGALAYFIALSATYLVFTGLAWRSITSSIRAREYTPSRDVLASPLTPAVSVLLPAYNEEAGVVECVRSVLALRYPEHEVIVVDDGSTDGTLQALIDTFELVPVRKALRSGAVHAPVAASYMSRLHPNLVVLHKEQAGKADALNCALAVARHPFICTVDADAILDEDALLRVAQPILDDPELIAATGGIVRVANGSRIEHGRMVEVGLPRNWLAALQVIEYSRAFLIGRIGWSRMQCLLIISGAFGLYRRSLVEAVGGFDTRTVGEDVELVVNLHQYLTGRGEKYRIQFVPDPVCWTEAPEKLRTLASQRRRWQLGLAETLWRYRHVAVRPRYKVLGLVAFPYFVLFELFGPLIEVTGYVVVPIAAVLGILSYTFLFAFLAVSLGLGILLSLSAVALGEFSLSRHRRGTEIARLIGYSLIEGLGFRQLLNVLRLSAFVDLFRRRREWGSSQRVGLASLSTASSAGVGPLPPGEPGL